VRQLWGTRPGPLYPGVHDNPLLIQKIVAERLSDKMQIMVVPTDGRNFFASDVFRSTLGAPSAAPSPAEETTSAAARTASRRR
jgi:hypothetical protein